MNKKLLKQLRRSKKLNQLEMAAMFNISEATYKNWESGRTQPSFKNLIKLCNILGTSPNEVLGFDRVLSDKEILERAAQIYLNSKK